MDDIMVAAMVWFAVALKAVKWVDWTASLKEPLKALLSVELSDVKQVNMKVSQSEFATEYQSVDYLALAAVV